MIKNLNNIASVVLVVDTIFIGCVAVKYLLNNKKYEKSIKTSFDILHSLIPMEIDRKHSFYKERHAIGDEKELICYKKLLYEVCHIEIMKLARENKEFNSKLVHYEDIEFEVKLYIDKLNIKINRKVNTPTKIIEKNIIKNDSLDIGSTLIDIYK